MTVINLQDVTRFFEFLDNPKEIFSYALFDELTDPPIPLPNCGKLLGNKQEIIERIQTVQSPFSLHTTLNKTNLKGRRRENIEGVRVLCVDLDEEWTDERLKKAIEQHKPQLVVRSSPGKHHLYWKLSPRTTLEQWSDLQLGVAFLFGGDFNLASVNHIIRVPGVERITKAGEGFVPYIIYALPQADCVETDWQWWEETWGLSEPITKAKELLTQRRTTLKDKVKAFQSSKDLQLENFALLAKEENRNVTLYSVIRNSVRQSAEEVDLAWALIIAEKFNEALRSHPKGRLTGLELRNTTESAFKNGLIARTRYLEWKASRESQAFGVLNAAEFQSTVEAVGTNGSTKYTYSTPFPYDFTQGNLALDRFTDMALVERVLQRFNHELVRVGETLFAFDIPNTVWRAQEYRALSIVRDMVDRCCYDTIADPDFATRFANTKDGISPDKLLAAIGKWKSAQKITSIAHAVWSSKKIARTWDSPFEPDQYTYFCASGALNLKTGEIRKPQAADYLLRRADVEYRPEVGVSAWWVNFLQEIFAKNENPAAMLQFMKEVFGYSLTGSVEEQVLFIHYGEGANGKSRVLAALAALTGDYSARLSPDSLGKSKNALPKAFERIGAKTEGKRVVVIDDLDSGLIWNEGLVKGLTDSKIISRRLYEEERDIPNRAKVHIGCNSVPKVENGAHAVYRRLAIIEYGRRFEVNPAKYAEITRMIEKEKSGILNWALEGLKDMLARPNARIIYPAEVLYAVQDYKDENSGMEERLLRYVEVITDKMYPLDGRAEVDNWITVKELQEFLESVNAAELVGLHTDGKEGLGTLLRRIGATVARRWSSNRTQNLRLYRVRLRKELKRNSVFEHITE